MATLRATLAVAQAAHLLRGAYSVVVTQDLDGECAVSVRHTPSAATIPTIPSAATLGWPYRCASLAEMLAYLAGGAVPGVRGDESDWVPEWA
jgi:hypothetical protein